MSEHKRVVIIGGGPAGFSAAIYAARAGLKPAVFVGIEHQTQMNTTTEVENYAGVLSVTGPELVQIQQQQAEKCGAEIVYEDVTAVDLAQHPFKITHGYEAEVMTCDALIFATGSTAQRLDVKGEKEYWMKGVSACAVCDGAMATAKPSVVVGGGDVACEEASYLANIASKVYMILRRDQFRASQAMVDRVKACQNIEIVYDSAVDEIKGGERVTQVVIRNLKTNALMTVDAASLFWCVGHIPQTELLKGQVELTKSGYVITKEKSSYTSVPGVFAAGDCQDWIYRQAIVAAGSGAIAALDCERWLADKGFK